MFTIEPLTGTTFGATVTDVDLSMLDDGTWRVLHEAWLEYALLVFPGQHLSREAQVAIARRIGPIEQLNGRDIVPLTNVLPDGSLRGDDDMTKVLRGNMFWHADSTYMEVQATGAVFSAEIVPSSGGETAWADMRAAYDALDANDRNLVDTTTAKHSLHYSQRKVGHVHTDESDYAGYGLDHEGTPVRPLVKVHPETGRRSLLIGRHAYGTSGMSPEASESFLARLVEEACQPPRVHEHRWRAGDVVLWDNRCLLHRGRPWDMTEPRVMWHSRIAGDPATESAELGPE